MYFINIARAQEQNILWFFHQCIWDWGLRPFQLEKIAIKQENSENSFLLMKFNSFYNLSKYLLKHNAPFSEVLEIIHFSVQSFW